jgi:hypothetical protein
MLWWWLGLLAIALFALLIIFVLWLSRSTNDNPDRRKL